MPHVSKHDRLTQNDINQHYMVIHEMMSPYLYMEWLNMTHSTPTRQGLTWHVWHDKTWWLIKCMAVAYYNAAWFFWLAVWHGIDHDVDHDSLIKHDLVKYRTQCLWSLFLLHMIHMIHMIHCFIFRQKLFLISLII